MANSIAGNFVSVRAGKCPDHAGSNRSRALPPVNTPGIAKQLAQEPQKFLGIVAGHLVIHAVAGRGSGGRQQNGRLIWMTILEFGNDFPAIIPDAPMDNQRINPGELLA